MARWRVGIDIGGTFTDVAAMNGDTGEVTITKVPSIPGDPSAAIMEGLAKLEQGTHRIHPGAIEFFGHGTTVATNALLEGKGAQAGLMITKGFSAIYELRGGTRPSGSDMIDLFYQKPTLLVPQKNTFQIDERIGFDGKVVRAIDEESIRSAMRTLRERGIRSVAVCFLFSFMNPAHERRVAEVLRDEYPDCRVTLSSHVLPVIREYTRISTSVLDAYVGPVVETYFRRLESRLQEAGVVTPQRYIMQSNGGLMRVAIASQYPNQTLLSGPAAGVVFGAFIGKATGQHNVVTFDMGGTSTDISVLSLGAYSETRSGKVSGQDLGTPMIDIRTLGAGGGTIAWIGPEGLLKVGPSSAGANPGPASYGRGGHEPTVTDANLVLGYLSPGSFIGGQLPIDPALAVRAIEEKVARPLGMSVQQAALGMHRVVNVNMEIGVRLSMGERGLDPRKFALVAFGGSGPVHGARVARNVAIPRVIVPPYPGISCAMGLLQTDIRHVYLHSRLLPLGRSPVAELQAMFSELEERALREAELEELDMSTLQLSRHVDVRYPHQGYELTVPIENSRIDAVTLVQVRNAFNQLHQDVYGVSSPEAEPEIVNTRVTLVSAIPHLALREIASGGNSPAKAERGTRQVLFEDVERFVEAVVYERADLRAGNLIQGPAIVEQMDSTTVLPPDYSAQVDQYGNLLIDVPAKKTGPQS